ncbi:MAG: ribosome maturation factor RimP [Candidatus Dormibacteraceae bacterium]
MDAIRDLLEPTLRHLGFEVYEIQQSGGSGQTLRVAIDRPEGVTIDDCARVSEVAGPLIDHAQVIPGRYFLEVSSPGAERPLRSRSEYERFVGSRVNVRYRMGGSEAVVEGDLLQADLAGIAVRVKTVDAIHIGWDNVLAGRLAVTLKQ